MTHGVNDHLLNISPARGTRAALQSAYHYTEYENGAFSLLDYDAAFGPTYEGRAILQWLLDQRKPL